MAELYKDPNQPKLARKLSIKNDNFYIDDVLFPYLIAESGISYAYGDRGGIGRLTLTILVDEGP